MLSSVQNIVVFDTETTGLKFDKNAIIEIACCPFDNELKDLEEFESGIMKVYDDREVTDGALNANGITRDQMANGIDSQLVADRFAKYLSKMKVGRNLPILAGHNIIKFDIPFIRDFMKVHKYDLDKLINTDFFIDTMWFARLRFTELTNYKLGTCCEELGVELTNAHRALFDTRANKNMLKELVRSLRSNSNSKGKEGEEYKRPVFEF